MIGKFLTLVLLSVLLPLFAHAQTTVIEKAPFENAATFNSNTNSVCWSVATGIHYWSMRWEEPLGTVTGGTVKLAGSMASTCSSPTDIIAAQTATSDGAVNGTFGAYKYVRLTFASYAGTGSVRVFVSGNKSSTAIGSAVTVTSGDINIANIPHVIVDSGGGGGIEYTEGDTDATIVGKAILMEVAANTLQPVQGTVADGLLVNLGTNNDVTVTGDALTALQLLDNIVKLEDDVAGTAFAGVPFLAVRQDSQSDLAADGDFIPLTVTADGGLRVEVTNGGIGGTAIADDGAFTVASTNVTPAGGCYQATPDSVNDGDAGCLRMTIDRKLIVTTGITESADNAAFDHTSTEPPVGMGGIYLASPAAHTDGDKATFLTDVNGRQLTVIQAGTTGGADALSFISAGATEDEHAVKATAGTLYSITATNTNAAVRYLKCENDTAANTAPGTDTPELRIAIPGATTGAGFSATFPAGYSFSTALTCWLVTGAADADVAEVAASELLVFYTFK